MKKIFLIFIFNIFFISFSFGQNISSSTNSSNTEILTNTYIQIIDSCNWAHGGSCVAVRSGPGVNFSKEHRLRNGIVLKVSEKVNIKNGDKISSWYKIDFKSEKIKKSERVKKDWYVNTKYTKIIPDVKAETYDENNYIENAKSEDKKIYINLKKQTLEAYDGETLFMKTKISTGLKDSPTESGEYFIHYKTPSRYMQDDATSTKVFYTATDPVTLATSSKSYSTTTKDKTNYKEYYDLPGVPFTMYFDTDGKAIHGAYWHNNFGTRHSHGCINLSLKDSEKLYYWSPVGAVVIVK
jgi:lipoprotein-anchoring transpeptidase ErfK/SrfK